MEITNELKRTIRANITIRQPFFLSPSSNTKAYEHCVKLAPGKAEQLTIQFQPKLLNRCSVTHGELHFDYVEQGYSVS